MEDLQKLRSRLSPEKQAILQQLLRGEGGRGQRQGSIPRRPAQEPPQLSFAQERLWFLDQLDPGSAAYNITASVRFEGDLDLAAVDATLREILRRHETLRTTFRGGSGQPVPRIASEPAWRTPLVDLCGLSSRDRDQEAARLAVTEDRRPFDLERGPLLRVILLRLDESAHVVLLAMHHIISDGWSIGVLLRELGALYRAVVAGAPSPLPDLPIQYTDFSAWQRQWLQGSVLQSQLAFWRERLGGELPVLNLTTDRPRPAVPSPRGEIDSLFLPESMRGALDALGRGCDATPFMVLTAAIEALLHRHTGQEDLLLGFPIANRRRAETEPLIGLFVNTLVLRTDLSGDPDLRTLLTRVRAGTLGAYEHQDLPFEKLVEELQPSRSLDRSPVFQAMVVFENAPLQPLSLPGLELRPYLPRLGRAQFELTWIFLELESGLEVVLDYDAELFDAATARRLLNGFRQLLAGMAAAPDRPISELPLLGEAERHQLAREWNDTAWVAPLVVCLHELTSAQARCTPEAVAAVFEGESLTYGELERRATALALCLVGLGVAVEGQVGVLVERSLEMTVGLLGVLKAGAAYVPLDPIYPAERLALLVESAGVSVVLAQERLVP
ncbi:MAG TPA: condensation domain-containing protein, partial [Thermoanaerobaculia bacterium]|nr:condensation domain-containing protein [Thermoanaerobaculia bacterium]